MTAPAPTFSALLKAPDARRRSVFINCPYDKGFRDSRAAIVFAVVCCGLLPRSADDRGRAGTLRMSRILDAMKESRYSIHDLSRCQGEGDLNLARFNMPLELGVALANGHASTGPADDHQWLGLAPEAHPYHQFSSDLAGYDLKRHNGTPTMVCTRVLSWLWTLDDAVPGLSLQQVLRALPGFLASYRELNLEWIDEPTWDEVWDSATAAVPA